MTPTGLEKAFDDLCAELTSSEQYFAEVRLTVIDAREGADTKAVVGGLAEQLADLLRELEEARHFGELARRGLRRRPPSMDEVGRCLSRVQDLYWLANRRYADEVVSHFRVDQVRDLARRIPRYEPWSDTVVRGLEDGRDSMNRTAQALHTCWNEALERALTSSVAVHTVSTAIRDGGETA
jgi:hypothetical protein